MIIDDNCGSRYLPPSSEFYPLLAHSSLADLSTLILSPARITSIILTDPDILTLTRTCPRLHILDLGSQNTPVSLHDLNVLVRRCHELCEVALRVDARVGSLGDNKYADDDDDDQGGLRPDRFLIKLDVGDSPVAYVASLCSSRELRQFMLISRFLHAMAPRLKSVKDEVWTHPLNNPWRVVTAIAKT
ncbi:hypothetical protein DFJ58DRAFT_268508 [Suillus subalutaceus]|uniref:uncharacterized protein n=1 Tax=Suillus subalutaceus TaxID=48586 RepID=UPI001B87F150|nr:uncharacterized protein DFJ58DRAFT_268508 [Suillus subalutaceus]KAG1860608.1 hypothetical protein DFJ58DRAFT_268508 [Suillus subalutaceus]